tara:strand:- start:43 stop:798 length:756 start_codon:yes stop_codon:yes gene_type:complete
LVQNLFEKYRKMKLKLFLLGVLSTSLSMNAQYTVEDENGNTVLDGATVTYGTLTYPEASFDFYVNNTSATETIRMKIEFVSAVNADGSNMELCFGLCYTGIVVGQSYPPNADYVEVLPGSQTFAGNHFYNADPGNGTDTLIYTFRFFQIDTAGNEIGDPLTLIYQYNPLLGVNSNKLNVNLFSTSIADQLVLTVDEELDLVVYDLQGRVVKSQRLEMGTQQINMSDVSPQMYLLHFQNNRGVSYTAKVVVK